MGTYTLVILLRPAMEPTLLTVQWAPKAIYPEVRRPELEYGHSPRSGAEVKTNTCKKINEHITNASWGSVAGIATGYGLDD
jgi:hypothetical protein